MVDSLYINLLHTTENYEYLVIELSIILDSFTKYMRLLFYF
jgi:hypothetical protein